MSIERGTPGYTSNCVICSRLMFHTRPNALYCSQACTQKAYRRRQADKRTGEALRRRERDAAEHRDAWIRFLIDAGSLSRKQAERCFVALMSIGRLSGPPYEQQALFGQDR